MEEVTSKYLEKAKIGRKQSYKNLAVVSGCSGSAAEGAFDPKRNQPQTHLR